MSDLFQAGPLRVRAFRNDDRDAPAVILCHGYGAPGDDLVPLARVTDAGRTRWFFPEAPLALDLEYGSDARAWWPVDMLRLQMELGRGARSWDPAATPEGMLDARDKLIACLRSLIDEQGLDPARTILGGFSQGAMIATDVVLTSDLGFHNLAILSGSHVSSARWSDALSRRKHLAAVGDLHVLQSHGRNDPILPFAIAEALQRELVAAGAHSSFIPFHGAHEIRPEVLDRLGRFARSRLHSLDVRE